MEQTVLADAVDEVKNGVERQRLLRKRDEEGREVRQPKGGDYLHKREEKAVKLRMHDR